MWGGGKRRAVRFLCAATVLEVAAVAGEGGVLPRGGGIDVCCCEMAALFRLLSRKSIFQSTEGKVGLKLVVD
jgi:hypothetical protein